MIPSISTLVPLLLLASQAVAIPQNARRQATATSSSESASVTEAPTPWPTVLNDGTTSTVTPVVSINSAGTTTINARPTDSSTNKDNQDVYARCDGTKYELAETGNTTPFAPFCAPYNGTNWWYTGRYYVTWNPSYWSSKNSTVKITLNYVKDGKGGKVADSWTVANSYGFIDVAPNKDWLLNQTARGSGENIMLDAQPMYFLISDNSPSTSDNIQVGPTIVLTANPTATPPDTNPNNRPPASTLGLAIGLPIMAVFAFGSVCCLHFCMRNRRKVGPISIGGGRKHFSKRGYSGRAERRRKAAMGGQAAYRDEAEGEDAVSPAERTAEWELANVKGGR